jgi:putative addiction module component (TIGR02574 family)
MQQLETLSVADKLQLVEELWDSIARSGEEIALSRWQEDELERRKQRYQSDPSSAISWERAKADILSNR